MLSEASGFDWDEGNVEKCQKHGVSVAEIEAVLGSDPAVAPDLKHSAEEDRLIAVGRNREGRPLFVAFTLRIREGRRLVRPVSARYMHQKEAERYEAARTQAEER
jgi:uncharacterized DUF497 family protein